MIKSSKFLQLIIAICLAVFISTFSFTEKVQFQDLALGEETKRYLATDDNNLIHIVSLTKNDESSFVKGWEVRGRRSVILLLGNSQSHSINQMREGDVSFVQILHDRIKSDNLDLLCNSIPNGNLQEFYLLLEYWKKQFPIQTLVLPIFMDDLRETGLRKVFFENIVHKRFTIEDTSNPISHKINKELSVFQTEEKGDENMTALKATVQEKVEKRFNMWLSNHSSTWQNRETMRGEMFAKLFFLRNTVFNISASTKRKIIPTRYTDNILALKNIISFCKKNKIFLILYIPPIRNDVPIPYDKEEYASFKSFILSLKDSDVIVKNYENIVPGQFWGSKEATTIGGEKEIDYMHFQYKGHEVLSDSLYEIFSNSLLK